jgi:NADH-quinone oxidoreductase subunit I
MCATVCPAKVIEIEVAFDPTTRRTRNIRRFEIDYSRCILRLCVEAAPGCDLHGQGSAQPADVRRGSLWLSLELFN